MTSAKQEKKKTSTNKKLNNYLQSYCLDVILGCNLKIFIPGLDKYFEQEQDKGRITM